MNTKNILKITAILTLCIVLGNNILASESTKKPEDIIKPCIDDQTFAVIHINLEKVNIEAYMDKAIEIASKQVEPEVVEDFKDSLAIYKEQANVQLNELKKAGCKNVFGVFSMYDFPYFFIAFQSGSDQAGLSQQILKMMENFNIGKLDLYSTDGLIIVGLEPTIARLKTIEPAQLEVLAKGFQSCGDTTIQAILFPSSDQRRIMTEMLSMVQFGNSMLDLTSLGKNFSWGALGFNGPPSITLNATIQSQNSDGAENILKMIKDFYSLAAQNNKVKEVWPQLDQALKLFTPEQNKEQLLLKINSTTADSIIAEFVSRPMLEILNTIQRNRCATNLKHLGIALIIYANDYDDNYPPNLEILISTEQMTSKGLMCPSTKQKDSYVYVGAGLNASDAYTLIMAYDKKGNHKDGRYVLFLDGHIEWIPEEELNKLIEADNKYRRDKGYPEISVQ